MSDTNPHIRHRVQMPNGDHIEVFYHDCRPPSDAEQPDRSGAPAQADGACAPGPSRTPGSPVPGCPPHELHVCFNCGGNLVYPLDWAEEGVSQWRILLRCPECEARREGVFEQAVVERLDDELDRACGALLSDLKRITHANMTEEIDFFVRALDADLIVPTDFCSPHR